jgi:hypothetical protein
LGLVGASLAGLGCTVQVPAGTDGSGEGDTLATTESGDESGETSGDEEDETDDGGVTPKLDVAPDDDGGDECVADHDFEGIGDCSMKAPPDSFDPVVEWSMTEDPDTKEILESIVIPLVGNFTDDDQNGTVDLCDTPDIVFIAGPAVHYGAVCNLYLLDGKTGDVHWKVEADENVSCMGVPAFGDIDDDGKPEIVTLYKDGNLLYRPKAFEHDGTPKWEATEGGDGAPAIPRQDGAIAIHDLDADGFPEILYKREVFLNDGTLWWDKHQPKPFEMEISTAADLDGDGDMEVLMGVALYHADGQKIWDLTGQLSTRAVPQIADLDGDGDAEILYTTEDGMALVEHTGELTWGPTNPTGVEKQWVTTLTRAATVHDFDGDGEAEWAASTRDFYSVFQGPDPADIVWSASVQDNSGSAAGTAFDFLGDGVAEAIYGDECKLRVYDGETGAVLLEEPRGSGTLSEYPVVADVDNDESAEILVVSHEFFCGNQPLNQPALQVFGEADSRWIQARRIWNQHAYYVTNVFDDGTIPVEPIQNWKTFNTFRTQAQIEGGGTCIPPG